MINEYNNDVTRDEVASSGKMETKMEDYFDWLKTIQVPKTLVLKQPASASTYKLQ